MAKRIWLGTLVVLSGCAAAGFFYANHQAEQVMVQLIEQTNKQYLELSEQGDIPAVQISYSELSANVLSSSYQIRDLTLSIAGMGDMLTVGQANLNGVQLDGLADQGSAQITDVHLSPAALQVLPAELASYIAALKLGLSYQYQYKASTGELSFQQELTVDKNFSLTAVPEGLKVFGIGGVTAALFQELQRMNFDGAVVLGALWNHPSGVVKEFEKMIKSL